MQERDTQNQIEQASPLPWGTLADFSFVQLEDDSHLFNFNTDFSYLRHFKRKGNNPLGGGGRVHDDLCSQVPTSPRGSKQPSSSRWHRAMMMVRPNINSSNTLLRGKNAAIQRPSNTTTVCRGAMMTVIMRNCEAMRNCEGCATCTMKKINKSKHSSVCHRGNDVSILPS